MYLAEQTEVDEDRVLPHLHVNVATHHIVDIWAEGTKMDQKEWKEPKQISQLWAFLG